MPRGRKSKYTTETIQKIVQALELGATHTLACAYANIDESTFYDWMNKKPDFSEAVKRAEGTAGIRWLFKIEEAATSGTWQAAAWKLERRYPREYGKSVQETQHTGTDGQPIVIVIGERKDGPQ